MRKNNISMTTFILLIFTFCIIYPTPSHGIFSIQETLTVICQQFPLVYNVNDSNLQCARLRTDENVPTTAFNLNTPTQLVLFVIIDQASSYLPSININIHFNQSSDSPSLINEIRLGILVSQSNFTINNQTKTIYTSYDIPIFRWTNSTPDEYNLIDVVQIENDVYETDTSLCKWKLNQWNRLVNGNISNNMSYVYFIKTTNSQLLFTLIDTKNKSSLSSPPTPYLNILYCIPYKLGVTEMVLIICFGVIFLVIVIILLICRYLKGGDDNRTRHFERYHNRKNEEKIIQDQSEKIRHRKSGSVLSVEHDDERSD